MAVGAGRTVGLASFALLFVAHGAVAITPDTVWNSASRAVLPTWVQVWIHHCIFWTPATVLFARKTRTTPLATPFGAWRGVVIGTAVFSLVFDYRDAVAFLS